ncbi:MAG: YwaF family protein [Clostridia bacterium]|nr:YwaF family protein [Clostridia bacterium]
MVQLFNFWYFFFIVIGTLAIVGLYCLLKNKSQKTQSIVLGSILFFNLALHFLKLTFPPYSTNLDKAMRDVWFINVCATSVLFFPFCFLSKSKTAKDYMVFLGTISGLLAFLYPTEAIDKSVLTLDLWRFYICHWIIIAVPVLTMLLRLHKLDIKRIWKMPICVSAMLLFIICNQILQSELGIIPLRDQDMFNINFHNPSLIWGPTDSVAVLFSYLTPDFMKTIPYGEFAGQQKYWPFFWMLPGVILYFILIPLIVCFIFDYKETVASFVSIFNRMKNFFTKKGKTDDDENN